MTNIVTQTFDMQIAAPPAAGQSVLAQAAQGMSPGQYQAFTTNGFNNGLVFHPAYGNSVLDYTDKATWNSVRNSLQILSSSHPSTAPRPNNGRTYFAELRLSDNTWNNALPLPPDLSNTQDGTYHTYHQETVDPNTGDFYYRKQADYLGKTVYRFNQSSQAWVQLPNLPCVTGGNVAGGMAYFPDRNSIIYVDGYAGVCEFSLASQSWTLLATSAFSSDNSSLPNLPMGQYSNIAEYSPLTRSVIFGAGDTGANQLYQMDANGSFTTCSMSGGPTDIEGGGNGNAGSLNVCDPNSGELLVWMGNNAPAGTPPIAFAYNPASNAWRSLPRPPWYGQSDGGVFDMAVGAVPAAAMGLSFGVIVIVYSDGIGHGWVYLYRHS